MERISRKEFYYALQNMKHAGLEVDSFGGTIAGAYSYWINNEKIMHHQIEYEEYYEIHEDYLKYTEFDIANLNVEYYDIQIKKMELEQREKELEYWFYNRYYCIEEKPEGNYDIFLQIEYEGEIYFVASIDFNRQKVTIDRPKKEHIISFLEFDKLFKEWHNIKVIEWD